MALRIHPDVAKWLVPDTALSIQSSGVTLSDSGGYDIPETVLTYQVPDGEVLAIARHLLPLLKLNTTGGGSQIGQYAKWSLGLITALDPDRVIPIGPQMHSYSPWYDLAVSVQRNPEYERALTKVMTRRKDVPVIVFNQDEQLVFRVKDSAVCDASTCQIEIPCTRGRAGSANAALALRQLELGV
jgi:hypothetical protein